ncbi:aspartic peptidase domain-containing protein [Lophiotrema nucula]|uniref:Aspartic peptidase domain-containing protein n=1 Tax=Lophiotrema nucula TaxID=690887 RepID=A0A6A5ZKW4_9PLEO|nr:aspartic peptidase domain-containing protein [Lophiotrema nucula]
MRRPRRDGVLFFELWAVLVLATLLRPCLAVAVGLEPRDLTNSSIPSPVSVAPTQNWDGIDGSWNSFALRVGDPSQFIRVFISTASQQTWAVHAEACLFNETDPQTNETVEAVDKDCYESRGGTFNMTTSTTWDEIGFYQLWTEKNLGLIGNGQYGYDTVGFGQPGEEGPTLKNTTVGTLVADNFWLGHFGVNAKPTNFSAFSDPSPSYMTYLFQQKYIPSLSFGYTAGAQYHFTSVLGSLTLGGYDSSRFIPNDLTFNFAPDNERDIVVGVVGITANSATKTNYNLLNRDSFTMYIDSTVAELWLPIEVCEMFEKAFGLIYDNTTHLYLVNDLLHQTLLAENASVTFSVGQKFSTNETVDITLPYAAFDQTAKPPFRGLQNSSAYFPIRRAQEENQFVLGRTFLQEAYLVVDWERQNFSLYQNSWVFGQSKKIVPIISPSLVGEVTPASTSSKHLSTGAIIGVAVGGAFVLAMAIFGAAWWIWRRRQKRRLEEVKAQYEEKAAAAAKAEPPSEKPPEDPPLSPVKDGEEQAGTKVFPKAELPAESADRSELSSDSKSGDPPSSNSYGMPSPVIEVDNTERQIFEMEGDMPTRQEAGGRQLSEKETLMVRERMYNGVDPTGPPDVSPIYEEPPRRMAPVSPSEVTMVNRRIPDVSPTTPRTPTDGALLEANDTFFQPPRAPRPEDTLLSPISPLDGSTDSSRRRFSYEF